MSKQYILVVFIIFASQVYGKTGVTTRYWDCCKPSCSWSGKGPVSRPVQTCSIKDIPLKNSANIPSGCDGGNAFACSNQGPFNMSKNVSYGFVAANLKGQKESDWCCRCYKLIFTNGPVKGKTMIVQVTNTGYDLQDNHFDIAIPGGGQGIFTGCDIQYKNYKGGQRYGGITKQSECNSLPLSLRKGCNWRFSWFKNADNPLVQFEKIKCPKLLTDISKCMTIG